LETAAERRKNAKVVLGKVEASEADDAFIADNGVTGEAGLAEEATADIDVGLSVNGEDGLTHKVNFKEIDAMGARPGGADVALAAVGEGEEDRVAGLDFVDGTANLNDIAGA
jgi:hypothetical protein